MSLFEVNEVWILAMGARTMDDIAFQVSLEQIGAASSRAHSTKEDKAARAAAKFGRIASGTDAISGGPVGSTSTARLYSTQTWSSNIPQTGWFW